MTQINPYSADEQQKEIRKWGFKDLYQTAHQKHQKNLDTQDENLRAELISLVETAMEETCSIALPRKFDHTWLIKELEEAGFTFLQGENNTEMCWGGDSRNKE